MSIVPITDHVLQALDVLLPSRPFGEVEDLRDILESWVTQIQSLENDITELAVQRTIDGAEGVQLDLLGELIGQERAELTDAKYRLILKAKVKANASRGLINEILDMVALVVSAVITYEQQGRAEYVLTWTVTDPTAADLLAQLAPLLEAASPAGVRFQAVEEYTAPGPIFQFDTGGSGFNQGLFQRYVVA
jgi:hypothetical protein